MFCKTLPAFSFFVFLFFVGMYLLVLVFRHYMLDSLLYEDEEDWDDFMSYLGLVWWMNHASKVWTLYRPVRYHFWDYFLEEEEQFPGFDEGLDDPVEELMGEEEERVIMMVECLYDEEYEEEIFSEDARFIPYAQRIKPLKLERMDAALLKDGILPVFRYENEDRLEFNDLSISGAYLNPLDLRHRRVSEVSEVSDFDRLFPDQTGEVVRYTLNPYWGISEEKYARFYKEIAWRKQPNYYPLGHLFPKRYLAVFFAHDDASVEVDRYLKKGRVSSWMF